jgi:hypothetical protein
LAACAEGGEGDVPEGEGDVGVGHDDTGLRERASE